MERRHFLGALGWLALPWWWPNKPKKGRTVVGYVPASSTPAANGVQLQNAITAAALGDIITLDPPSVGVYQGNFTFPGKGAGTSFISIEPVALASFPAGRVTTAEIPLAPRLETNTSGAVLAFSDTAHHYKFQGLNITTTAALGLAGVECPALINDAGGATIETHTKDIIFERCLIHPFETDPLLWRAATHASQLNGENITFSRCKVYDFMGWLPQVVTDAGHTYGSLWGAITATNANPVVITIANGSLGDVGVKRLLTFSGATGVNWSGLNGTKLATWVSSNQYSLQNYDPVTYAATNINSTSWGALTGSPVLMTADIATSSALTITVGPGPYTVDDCHLESYYSQIFTGGAGGTLLPAANDTTVTFVSAIDRLTLASIGAGGADPLAVGDLIAFQTAAPQSVSAATTSPDSSTPCRLTVATHRFSPVGGRIGITEGGVHITGATGAWTVLNTGAGVGNPGNPSTGNFYGKVVDTTHIDLYQDMGLTIPFTTVGLSQPLTGTVTWVPDSPSGSGQWQVGRVATINTGTKEITYDFAGHTSGGVGNGAGVPVASGSVARFNGICIHGITIRQSQLSCRKNWIDTLAHVALTGNNHGSTSKGTWESKHATDVLIEGCIIDVTGGNVGGNFTGPTCIALNQNSQVGGTPWTDNSRWIIRNNIFKHYTYLKLSCVEEYFSGTKGGDILIENNLFTPSNLAFIGLEGTDNVRILHNTVRNYGGGSFSLNEFIAVTHTNTNTIIRNNIGNWVQRGYNNQGGVWTTPVFEKNFLINNLGTGTYPEQGPQPAGDVYVEDDSSMGFVNVASADADGDYHGYALTAGSMGHNQSTDIPAKDVGVDFALLDAALDETPDVYVGRLGGAFDNRIFRVRY